MSSLLIITYYDYFLWQDSFPVSVSASSDPMFFYFDKPDGGHCNLFEAGIHLKLYLFKHL
jgi:hypothetical protein